MFDLNVSYASVVPQIDHATAEKKIASPYLRDHHLHHEPKLLSKQPFNHLSLPPPLSFSFYNPFMQVSVWPFKGEGYNSSNAIQRG